MSLLIVFNVHDRFESMMSSAVSLLSSDLPKDTTVIFYDDFSKDSRVYAALEYLGDNKSKDVDIIYKQRPFKVDTYSDILIQNFNLMKDMEGFDYYMTTDSDMFYLYDWWSTLLNVEPSIKKLTSEHYVMSSYNGTVSSIHEPIRSFGSFITKKRAGCASLVMTEPTVKVLQEFSQTLIGDKLNVGEKSIFSHLDSIGGVFGCLSKSKVEHIGDNSLLRHYHKGGRVDKGVDFDTSGTSFELYGKESDKKSKSETEMAAPRYKRFTKGRGVDLGCGPKPINGTCITIDARRYKRGVPAIVGDATDLSFISDGSMDYCYSSHCLEDVKDPKAALVEWSRVLKTGGYLVLYMPDKDYYYNVGHPKANKDHVIDYRWEDIFNMTKGLPLDLVVANRYGPVYKKGEWSFELILKKVQASKMKKRDSVMIFDKREIKPTRSLKPSIVRPVHVTSTSTTVKAEVVQPVRATRVKKFG